MSAQTVYLCSGGPHGRAKQMTEDIRQVFQANHLENPKVAYIGTAHLDDRFLINMLKPMMLKAGAGAVDLVPIVKHYDEEKARLLLASSDIIFVSGGEVEDGIVWLRKRGLDKVLTDLYNQGKPFFGISAGCIMMGQHWVHWDKEGDDSTSSLFDCLVFLPFTFDAHGESEDWTELKCAVRLMGKGAIGYGLSDGGFFSADKDGNLKIFRNPPAIYANIDGKPVRK